MTAHVMRLFSRRLTRLCVTLFALFVFSGTATAATQESSVEPTLTGRLATVEPSARRITMLPEGAVDLIELFVSDDAVVEQAERPATLTQLVIQTGRRITVHYRLDGERRVAVRIIVAPE